MGLASYFFDTYALFSLVEGRESYTGFLEFPVNTTIFNLVELYFLVLRKFGEQKAKTVYYQFRDCVMDLSDEVVCEAVKFRLQNINKKLSYADCIGYISARNKNLLFLTGDGQFEKFDNVEFVK